MKAGVHSRGSSHNMQTTTRTLTALIFGQYVEPAVSSATATSVALFPFLMPCCTQLIPRSHVLQGAGDVACWPPSPAQEPAPRCLQCSSCRGCLFSACIPRLCWRIWLCLVHKGKGYIGRERLGRSFPALSLLAHTDTPSVPHGAGI